MKKIVCICIAVMMAVMFMAACTTAEPAAPASAPASEAAAPASAPASEVASAPASAPASEVAAEKKPEGPPSDSPAAQQQESLTPVTDTKAQAPAKPLKIGIAWYDLNNPSWAEMGKFMVEYAKSQYGSDAVLVSAEINAAKQVTQLENFVESGVDAIVVGCVDAASIADVTKKAQEKGIKIVAYAFEIENFDADLIANNYETGKLVAKEAAAWIDEKLGGKAKIGIMNFTKAASIILREDGIRDGLKEFAPNSEIVATAEAATVEEGMTNCEAFLQQHPDMSVVCSIGDGGAVGAAEAAKSADVNKETFGTFGVDGTELAIQGIHDGDPVRMTVSFGNLRFQSEWLIDLAVKAVNGEKYEKKNFLPYIAINQGNVDAFAKEIGYTFK